MWRYPAHTVTDAQVMRALRPPAGTMQRNLMYVLSVWKWTGQLIGCLSAVQRKEQTNNLAFVWQAKAAQNEGRGKTKTSEILDKLGELVLGVL